MKKQCVTLLGLVFVIGLMVGCASRTKIITGPLQVAGEVRVFDAPQAASFDFSIDKIGFTIGHLGWNVESMLGPCTKVLSIESSTGDPSKVFIDIPSVWTEF